jgi:hypothetical protein
MVNLMHHLRKIFKVSIFLFISIIISLTGLYVYAYLSPSLDIKKSGSFYLYDDQENLIYQGSKSGQWDRY